MSDSSQENLVKALESMGEDREALGFIESAKENNPLQLFLLLSQIILEDSATPKIICKSIVLMSSLIRPTIVRPLNVLKNEFQTFDSSTTDSIKQSLFKCLILPEQTTRLSSAICISFFAQIEFPQKKWQDVFDNLKALAEDTSKFGEWAQIGAISAMKEILSQVKIHTRWPVYQSASNAVINLCMNVMSSEIEPDLKIEVVKCLQIAISLFINVYQSDAQFCQQFLELIIANIQIENEQLHQQLFILLSTFLIKIYKILNEELIGQIFTSIISDISSNNETKQYDVILLCKKLAKYELELFQEEDTKDQFCITEILEKNFDEIFLKIIANGDFSILDEAESPLITQYAALSTLYVFGKVSPEILYQDCATFYETYKSSEVPSIQLSAFCAVQVISSIQTDDAFSFIDENIGNVLEFCGNEDQIVRSAAFSVLKAGIEDKPTILCKPENFESILQVIRFGLESNLQTARYSLCVFKSLCNQSSNLNEGELLALNFESIIEMLNNAQERADAFENKFIEELYDALFIYIQELPKNKICQDLLTELFKKVFNHYAQTSSASSIEERQRSCDLYIIIGIIQFLENLIIPFGGMLLSTLIQELLGTEATESASFGSFNCNEAYKIIFTISQIVFYTEQEALPYLEQLVIISERAQESNSISEVNKSANLIGNIASKLGKSIMEMGEPGATIIQRLFNLVYSNLNKVETLLSSIPYLLSAMSDIIKSVVEVNAEYANQLVGPVMELSSGYVKNLEYYVNSDFDAANSIANELMNLFTNIIYAFPLETDFISDNLKSVFIQVPIIVWNHKMLTYKTVKYFLSLMMCLIRIVGRKNCVELNNKNLKEFVNYANSDNSPYEDLIPTAKRVKKFYIDILGMFFK